MNKLLPVTEDNFDKLARIVVDTNRKVDALNSLKLLLAIVIVEIPLMMVIL